MERIPAFSNFIHPEITRETGEIERVSLEVFDEQDTANFFSRSMEIKRRTG